MNRIEAAKVKRLRRASRKDASNYAKQNAKVNRDSPATRLEKWTQKLKDQVETQE